MASPRISYRGVVVHNNKVLLLCHDGRDCWNVPGGGFETYDADFAACAVRETKEEANIDCTVERFLFAQELHHEFKGKSVTGAQLHFLLTPVNPAQFVSNPIDPDNPDRKTEATWVTFYELRNHEVRPKFLADNLLSILQTPDIHYIKNESHQNKGAKNFDKS